MRVPAEPSWGRVMATTVSLWLSRRRPRAVLGREREFRGPTGHLSRRTARGLRLAVLFLALIAVAVTALRLAGTSAHAARPSSGGRSHPARARHAASDGAGSSPHFTLHSVDQAEREQVERLYNVLVAAKKKAGEKVTGSFDSFTAFVQKKTEQIRKQYQCEGVEYSVELADGHVKLKAKART